MARATLRYYGPLAALAGARLREFAFAESPAAKHAIESHGVPHTEVELLLRGGAAMALEDRLEDGDRLSVYPHFYTFELGAAAAPAPARFLLDCHLGRLAKYLRVLGFDSDYERQRDDGELARLAEAGERILLTMDRGLLMRRAVRRGYLVRESAPARQLVEVLRRYRLWDAISPFQRCLRCNAALEPAALEEHWEEIPPKTRAWLREYQRCARCRQLYWKGSHYERMLMFIERLRG